jgi:hypothetical protein
MVLRKRNIHTRKIFIIQEVISQFSSTKLILLCHLVSFKVSTISCSTHVKMMFSLTPHAHRHNVSHCSNLWHVPAMFDNFLRWLATLNSAVMPVHDTTKMEFHLIRKTRSIQESLITANFLLNFFTESPIIYQEKTSDLQTLQHYTDCNSDQSYVCQHKAQNRISFWCVTSN